MISVTHRESERGQLLTEINASVNERKLQKDHKSSFKLQLINQSPVNNWNEGLEEGLKERFP